MAAKPHAPLPEGLPANTVALTAALADGTITVASGSAVVFSGPSLLSNSVAAARIVEVASMPWVTAATAYVGWLTSCAGCGVPSGGSPRSITVGAMTRTSLPPCSFGPRRA